MSADDTYNARDAPPPQIVGGVLVVRSMFWKEAVEKPAIEAVRGCTIQHLEKRQRATLIHCLARDSRFVSPAQMEALSAGQERDPSSTDCSRAYDILYIVQVVRVTCASRIPFSVGTTDCTSYIKSQLRLGATCTFFTRLPQGQVPQLSVF